MRQLQSYLNEMSFYLNNAENSSALFGVLLGLTALAILLRIVVCVGWQTQYALFKMNAKDIAHKADLAKFKLGVLKNVIMDYVKISDKNTSSVHLDAIVEKHLLRQSIIGWSFDSIERFLLGFELALPVVGLVLAVAVEGYRILFCAAAVGVFLLLRIFAAVFDFPLAKRKLSAELIEYVEREVGQFYAGDFGTVLLRFKNELTEALARQSESLRDVISKLESNLSGALSLTMKEMSKELSDIGGVLNKPLQLWGEAISNAAAEQQKSIGSLQGLEKAMIQMQSLSQTIQNSLQAQGEYIEKSRAVLEDSVAQHESNLKQLTSHIGDGFGSMLDFHVKQSYQALNEHLQGYISQVTGANHELMLRLETLFDQLMEQSRSETGAILHLNDQISLHFDASDNRTP
jgi:hypothetical protein